jgi:hypothetical protein
VGWAGVEVGKKREATHTLRGMGKVEFRYEVIFCFFALFLHFFSVRFLVSWHHFLFYLLSFAVFTGLAVEWDAYSVQ